MGVEFYHCDCCKESRYEEYVGNCTECGHSLCTYCLTNDDIESNYASHYGVIYDGSKEQKELYGIKDDWEEKGWVTLGELIDDTYIDPKYCPYCQIEKVDINKFHDWVYKKLGKSKEELLDEYSNV